MGRSNSINDAEYQVEFEIERLRWVDGDYDEGGAYWGRSGDDYIYRAEGHSADAVESIFVRARGLDEAKAEILKTYPNATFAPSAELEEFLSAYIEAALWSTSNDRYEDDPENESEFLDGNGRDLAPECEAVMRADCAAFLEKHGDLVREATEREGYSVAQAGHDFWLTRNGHGVGFSDRKLGDLGERLDDAAGAFGERDLYVGDDDLIHIDGEEPTVIPTLG